MSSRAQDLLREALGWSADERAGLAAELLASLDEVDEEPAEVEASWAAEIEKRARRALSDASSGTGWEELRERADADLRNR